MPFLELAGLSKSFPGVLALDGVSLSLEQGEVRALMGENGAGKSTLIKVLTGVHAPDAGEIRLQGRPIRPRTPVHAQELGVSTVYQEVNLVPNLSVAENVCLGDEPRALGSVAWRKMRARAKDALDRLDVKVDVSRPLEEYSTAVRQLVAIARAVDRSAKVLVLDEPTSSLDRDEVARLFALVKRLKGEGMAIVFVTHFLDQVFAVADSVTVLRNGRKVGDWPTADLSRRALVAHMLGRELEDVPHAEARPPTGEEALLSVEGLGRSGTLRPATFRIQAGETVGLAGLLGSGRTETMRLVFGATPADCGSVVISGRRVRPRSPRAAIRMGMGFCPEDRKADGVCPGLSVAENLLLVVQARRGWHRPLGLKKARAMVAEHVEKLQIKARDAGAAIETLSGGNQQKVLLARWLAADPELLLLDEPTRGIDVGRKFEVRKLIVELAKRGMSFLFSSAELEEVVHTCDRVVVLRDRAIVGEVSGPGLDEQTVMAMIAEGDA